MISMSSYISYKELQVYEEEGRYISYKELQVYEEEGRDYQITYRRGTSGVAVIAPHGGGIEPGTSEIADATAGTEHTFYSFRGLKPDGNRVLHIASIRFDEPVAVSLLKDSHQVLAIHGCNGQEKKIYIGGLDLGLKHLVRNSFRKANFVVEEHETLKGVHRHNLCNRNRTGMGVQLEITAGLRSSMFETLHTGQGRKRTTRVFKSFVSALREALLMKVGSMMVGNEEELLSRPLVSKKC